MAERMAGDELKKYGKLGEKFGDDYVDRVKAGGLQDDTKQGYSRKELTAEFRYGRGEDQKMSDLAAEYQGKVDSGEYRGNRQAQEFLEMHGVNFGNGEDSADIPDPVETDPVETEPVTSDPAPTVGEINIDTGSGPVDMGSNPNSGGSGGSGGQTVVQDNDQTSAVVGSGNTVTQNQDNSISQNGFNSEKAARATGLKDNYILNLMNRKGT